MNLYQALGEADGLQKLVKNFYRHMSAMPETATIRGMHPADISSSEEKLYFFLSGWTGGPQLFVEKYGHPMLRRRHLPFRIGEGERDQWMLCMDRAMREAGVSEPLLSQLYIAFHDLADHMRNVEEVATD